jgi:hypothetical protein
MTSFPPHLPFRSTYLLNRATAQAALAKLNKKSPVSDLLVQHFPKVVSEVGYYHPLYLANAYAEFCEDSRPNKHLGFTSRYNMSVFTERHFKNEAEFKRTEELFKACLAGHITTTRILQLQRLRNELNTESNYWNFQAIWPNKRHKKSPRHASAATMLNVLLAHFANKPHAALAGYTLLEQDELIAWVQQHAPRISGCFLSKIIPIEQDDYEED